MNAFERTGVKPLSYVNHMTPIGRLRSLRIPIWNGVQLELERHGEWRRIAILDWRGLGGPVIWQHKFHVKRGS